MIESKYMFEENKNNNEALNKIQRQKLNDLLKK